jgi:hypothetical protein
VFLIRFVDKNSENVRGNQPMLCTLRSSRQSLGASIALQNQRKFIYGGVRRRLV